MGHELRITTVYRARCFANENELANFHQRGNSSEVMIPLERIFDILGDELVARSKINSMASWRALSRHKQAMVIVDEFIRYPLPTNAWIPYNYCVIPQGLPK